MITDANGCTSDESLPVNVQISGFEENNPQFISVYPNPTMGLITIEMGEGVPVEVELYNTVGQVVYTHNSKGEAQFVLDLSELPQGVYLLRIGSDGSYVNKRVTVSK